MTELTILMPCLNEGESVAYCVRQAQHYLESRNISGQVLIVDNGSTDGSPELARKAGADVVVEQKTGYGNAVRKGIQAAKGKYIILSDCDGSYDLSNLDAMVEQLRSGCHLVVGNRFQGGIAPKAMPFAQRYFAVPVLSLLGKLRFRVDIGDFCSGLRGFSREAALSLPLRCPGKEFATEIIGRFAQGGFRVCQVPIRLKRDMRSRPGRPGTASDGLGHLRLLLCWHRA